MCNSTSNLKIQGCVGYSLMVIMFQWLLKRMENNLRNQKTLGQEQNKKKFPWMEKHI